MKARIAASTENTFEEAVTVNQRALVDKILARYSTELTLFRELLQNANDARATALQIRFDGTGFWQAMENGSQKRVSAPLSFTGLRMCNNGMVFRDEDWKRIKSIADGNPDESKIGFFGVGFYSVFSLCDEPTVMSGEKALSFFWKKDALFVTHGQIPKPEASDSPEMQQVFELVNRGWTVFDLPVRKDPPIPELPSLPSLTDFLIRALTFTTTLEVVEVFYDGRPVLTVGRKVSGKAVPLSSPFSITDPKSMFRFTNAFTEPLLYAVKRFDQREAAHVEMMRVQSRFSVNVDEKFKAAMHRVTKKNPPKTLSIQLLFDVQSGHEVAENTVLGSFSPATERGGYFFIGSGITQQSTGTKCHCQAPFMPTMERNAMDFSDITLATWNKALIWVTGALHRLAFEHRCNYFELPSSSSSSSAVTTAADGAPQQHDAQASPADPQLELVKRALFTVPTQTLAVESAVAASVDTSSSSNDKNGGDKDDRGGEEKEDSRAVRERVRVHTSMATFSIARTTPVVQVGDIIGAGFFGAMDTAPTVWTTKGAKPASVARLRDETGLHELVTTTCTIVSNPSRPKPEESLASSAGNAIAKQAKSAFGFFASFLGSDAPGAEDGGKSQGELGKKKETLADLCERFTLALQRRRILRELDVRDLESELRARELVSEEEAVTLLKWLIKRHHALQKLRRQYRHGRNAGNNKETISVFCSWCGSGTQYDAKAVQLQLQHLEESAAQSSKGLLQTFASSIFSSGGSSDAAKAPITIPVKCSHCSQVSQLNPKLADVGSPASIETSSKYTSRALLKLARYRGNALGTFRLMMPPKMFKRIEGSCNKSVAAPFRELFWGSQDSITAVGTKAVLPAEISEKFDPSDLRSLDSTWLGSLTWGDWALATLEPLQKLAKPLPEEKLCLASNVLRVLAYARYYNEIDQESLAILCSAMMNSRCVPVSSHELMVPHKTYLGTESTGGFSSLPVAVVVEALDNGSFVLSKNEPKDKAISSMLTLLGVKEHADLEFIFSEFSKGSLGWNRQEILHYLAELRSKMDAQEVSKLRRLQFLPAMEHDSEGRTKPSLRSYLAQDRHLPDPDLAKLGVPMVFSILEEGLYLSQPQPQSQDGKSAPSPPPPPRRTYFQAHAEDTPGRTNALLKELGIHTHPKLELVLDRASRESHMRDAALKYLLKNFTSTYRNAYAPAASIKLIPCTNGRLESPLDCYTNPKVMFLGQPHVDATKLGLREAQLLGVQEHPNARVILQCLRDRPPDMKTAKNLFEYLVTLLPSFSNKELRAMKNIRFIPYLERQGDGAEDDANRREGDQVRHHAPEEVFFRPLKGPGKYEGLFPYVNFTSQQANVFLKTVGVREEPTIDELAGELATDSNAQRHVENVGFPAYIQILRLIAVEWQSGAVSNSSKRKLANSKCLVAQQSAEPDEHAQAAETTTTDEEPEFDEKVYLTYSLQRARNIYIADSDEYERLFTPLVAPQDNLFEAMYASLGSRYLSAAVRVETKARSPYTVTPQAEELEKKIRKRIQLFFFKRKKSDFRSNHQQWIKQANDKSRPFVFRVPEIKRYMLLDRTKKSKACTACIHSQGNFLLVTDQYDLYECASELCSALLVKKTVHDNLLWCTILQQDDQTLRAQGFPIHRTVHVPKLAVKKDVPPSTDQIQSSATTASAATTTAAAAAPPPAPAPAPAPSKQSVSPVVAPAAQDSNTLAGPDAQKPPRRRSSVGGGLRSLVNAALPKGLSSPKKQSSEREKKQKLQEMFELQQKQQQQQQQQQPQPKQQIQSTQSAGGNSGNSDGGYLVHRDQRRDMLLNGLHQSNGSHAGPNRIQQSHVEREMLSVMDDLHDHELDITNYTFAGLKCYLEKSVPYNGEFEKYSVEATAFAQLLIGIVVNIFGLRASVASIYYHKGGPTAAFNRGGALFFNLFVFLQQMRVRGWSKQLHVSSGPSQQPEFTLPSEAIIEWYGVVAHELAHNLIAQHDATFANYMSYYLLDYIPLLNAFVEQCELKRRAKS